MPIKGVNSAEEGIIKTILEPYRAKYDFYYFGSRVKGDFRELSDLDILVEGRNKIELNDIDDIKTAFDESRLPYVVNIVCEPDSDFFGMVKPDLVKII